jgi:hypothetical protein
MTQKPKGFFIEKNTFVVDNNKKIMLEFFFFSIHNRRHSTPDYPKLIISEITWNSINYKLINRRRGARRPAASALGVRLQRSSYLCRSQSSDV